MQTPDRRPTRSSIRSFAHRVLPALAALVVAAVLIAPVDVAAARGAGPSRHLVESRDGITIGSQIVDGRTQVERVRPHPERLLTLDRPLELRAVEPGGQRAVLADPLPPGATPFRPGGRAVDDARRRRSRRRHVAAYTVARNVEPEAFGVGSPLLYLIDHRPKRDPISYRVTALDLNTGLVERVLGPYSQKIPLDDMTADARQQVVAPSGRQLYTLYVETAGRATSNPSMAGAASTGRQRARNGPRPSCTCSTSPSAGRTA